MSPSDWPPGPSGQGGWPGSDPAPGGGSWTGAGSAQPTGPGPWSTASSPTGSTGAGWGPTSTSAGWGSAGGGWGSSGEGWGAAGTQPAAGPAVPGSGAPSGGSPWTPTAGEVADPAKARPPVFWLWAAIAGPVIGIGLLFLRGWTFNAIGWAVSILVGLGLLVVFTTADLRRRASPWYLPRPGLVAGLRLAVAAGAIVVAGIHAYLLADYIARLDVWVSR